MAAIKCNELYNTYDINLINGAMSHCCKFEIINLNVNAQNGVWTWMHGDNFVNSLGIYGTQAVSTSFNKPPSRYQAAYWTDQNGDFWFFGVFEDKMTFLKVGKMEF